MIPSRNLRYRYAFFRLLEHFAFTHGLRTYARNKQLELSHKAFLQIKSHRGSIKQIDRVRDISPQELKHKYINKGKPVVIEGGASNWKAIDNWTPKRLKDQFGEDDIEIFEADPNNSNDLTYEIKQAKLKEIFEAMENEDPSKYSRFNRLLYNHPELLNDFDYSWLNKVRCTFASGKTFQVFLGAIKSVTSLHAASEHNIFTQVHGHKHWYILDSRYDILLKPPVSGSPYFYTNLDIDQPDIETYPCFKHLDILETTLGPGDILFNPPSFWHQVTNKSSSIGVGFRWFGVIDCFRFNFTQALLTIFSKNPPIWVAKKYRTDFAKIFRYMNSKNKKT